MSKESLSKDKLKNSKTYKLFVNRHNQTNLEDIEQKPLDKPKFPALGEWEWDDIRYDWYDNGRGMYYDEIEHNSYDDIADADFQEDLLNEDVEDHLSSEKVKTPRGTFRVYDGTWEDFKNEPDVKEWGLWFTYIDEDNKSDFDVEYNIMHNSRKQHAVAVKYRLKRKLALEHPDVVSESVKDNKTALNEGIWALPFSKNKANKLKELMSNKLEYTEELLDNLYDLTGDDALFDDIEHRIDDEEYQGKDARELLKEYLKVILDAYEKEPEAFSDNLDYDAAKILKELIK